MTARERLSALEAQRQAHAHEHTQMERFWAGQLEAINARLGRIEAALNGWRSPQRNGVGGSGRRRISTRDVGTAGGGMALGTLIWWALELLLGAVETG